MLESTLRAIRPGGRMVVLQYMRPRGDEEQIRKNFTNAGFEELSSTEFADEHSWLFVFGKPLGEGIPPVASESSTQIP